MVRWVWAFCTGNKKGRYEELLIVKIASFTETCS